MRCTPLPYPLFPLFLRCFSVPLPTSFLLPIMFHPFHPPHFHCGFVADLLRGNWRTIGLAYWTNGLGLA